MNKLGCSEQAGRTEAKEPEDNLKGNHPKTINNSYNSSSFKSLVLY